MSKPNPNALLYQKFMLSANAFYDNEFSKHPEFTGNFALDRNKDSFGRGLKAHMEGVTGITNPFNHRTLITMVIGGIAPNARLSTLDTIAKFCGYDGHASFLESRPSYTKPLKKSYLLWVAAAVLLLAGVLVFWKITPTPDIHRIIHHANQAQFEAYRALPEVKTDELKKYYTENGSAYKVIVDILERSAAQNRVITEPENNPSYYTIHEIKILKKNGRIVAETQEHWYLRWYCLTTHTFIKKYDETNRQIYILRKVKGVWKIDANDFEGTAEVIKD